MPTQAEQPIDYSTLLLEHHMAATYRRRIEYRLRVVTAAMKHIQSGDQTTLANQRTAVTWAGEAAQFHEDAGEAAWRADYHTGGALAEQWIDEYRERADTCRKTDAKLARRLSTIRGFESEAERILSPT